MAKRIFDLVTSFTALLVLAPLFILIALLVKIDSPGPVFFRQSRVGRHSKPFNIRKFRTMHVSEQPGSNLTVGRDSRVTKIGFFLRKYKLDELPQLVDVFVGDMSLVGPRPEVPEYVALYPKNLAGEIFSVRPGITDLASIEYKDENSLLGESNDPDQTYRNVIIPRKVEYYLEYVRGRSFFGDIKIIFKTVCALIR